MDYQAIVITFIQNISPYLFRMRENADQNNSEYGHFSRSTVGVAYRGWMGGCHRWVRECMQLQYD